MKTCLFAQSSACQTLMPSNVVITKIYYWNKWSERKIEEKVLAKSMWTGNNGDDRTLRIQKQILFKYANNHERITKWRHC